jgi:hypothetical protein
VRKRDQFRKSKFGRRFHSHAAAARSAATLTNT